ncbi:MAG: hypothetical protein AB8B50_17200 [Pirellulaceae bacterium]
MTSESAMAQLTVLSAGNRTIKWKDTQLETLRTQLKDQPAVGALRLELESQVKWLEAWEPKSLGLASLWESPTAEGRYVEPPLDPNKRATALRERLLGKAAKPTSRDTARLEKLLSVYPNDIGIRQLHLHWLDQTQYRKQYADEIAEASQRLIGLLEQVESQTRAVKVATVFCLYRRGRALAYRELPDVVAKDPISEPEKHSAALLGTYTQLISMVGEDRPEFILLQIRMLRRDHWYGRALHLLESNGSLIEQKWFLKKRRDLLRDLGWQEAAKEASAVYAKEFAGEVEKEAEQAAKDKKAA